MYAGQQVRVLGENYTMEDEEDSRVGLVGSSSIGLVVKFEIIKHFLFDF